MRLRAAYVGILALLAAPFVWLALAQIQNEVVESDGYHRYPGGIAIGDPARGVGCLNWSPADTCFFLDTNCNFDKDMGEVCYCLCTTTSTSTSSSTIATTTSTVATTSTVSTSLTTLTTGTTLASTTSTVTTTTTSTSSTTSTLVFAVIGGHSAVVNSSTGNIYLPLTSYDEGPCTSLAACGTFLEHDQVLTTWSIQLSSALTGDQTLVAAIVYDPPGAPGETVDATMPLGLSIGDIGDVADGSLTLEAGTLVAVKYTLAGSAFTSKTIRTHVFGFSGRPFFPQSQTITSTPAGISLSGNGSMVTDGGNYATSDSTAGDVPGSLNPLPDTVTITGAGIHVATSLVTDSTFDLHQSRAGATNGQIDLPAGEVNAVTNIFDWPINTDWNDVAVQADLNGTMNYWEGNLTATRRTQIATSYLPATAFRHYSILLAGLGFTNDSGWAIPGLFPVEFMIGAGPDQTDTQVRLIRWPNIPGTFQYLLAYGKANYSGASNMTMTTCLYCGGACKISASSGTWSLASTNNPIFARNDVGTYHITSGETCDFRTSVTGLASGLKMGASIAFLPDTAPGATTTSTSTSSTTSTSATTTSTSSTTSTSL